VQERVALAVGDSASPNEYAVALAREVGKEVDALRAQGLDHARPEADSLSDAVASRTADERVAEAPKSHDLAEAEAQAADAQARLDASVKGAQAAGMDEERVNKMLGEIAEFDKQESMAREYAAVLDAMAACGRRT
jgi:hypothetical protein